MAINPNLVSIIPASELPTGVPTSAGEFFFYEGDEMKKSPMTEIYELVSGSQSIGTITPSSTIPTDGNVWGFAGEGTYPNAGNITVASGKFAILSRVGTTWSKVEVALQSGKSAYEVAVANGFVGTEAEWLNSLKSSITNLSVTPQKTTMFINQNIFDKETMVISGKYVRGGDGLEIVESEWSFITVPIDATLGNSIAVNKGTSNISTTDDEIHFFNNVGARIGGSNDLIATIPAGAVLMKMNISNTLAALASAKDTFMVAYSTTTPTTYYPYKYILNPIYIEDLVELKSNIIGKKVRFVGDSITKATGQVGLIGYVSRIATNTGIIATNKGDSGATIGNIYPSASCMSGALLQYQFEADTDLCVFWGGTNDFANNIAIGTNSDGANAIDTTFKGSLYMAIQWVRDNYPNCKILVMTPIERSTNNNNSLGLKLIDYRNAIVDICVLMNIPYLDLYNNNLISMATAYKYLYDGLHPNNAGYEVLTPVIQEAILKILS